MVSVTPKKIQRDSQYEERLPFHSLKILILGTSADPNFTRRRVFSTGGGIGVPGKPKAVQDRTLSSTSNETGQLYSYVSVRSHPIQLTSFLPRLTKIKEFLCFLSLETPRQFFMICGSWCASRTCTKILAFVMPPFTFFNAKIKMECVEGIHAN